MENMNKRIAARRKELGLTLGEIAAFVGVNKGTVSRWESGGIDNMRCDKLEKLAANLFRATQTEEKLRRDEVQGKENANATHYGVGKKVRQTIAELGGTMPEHLPTPDKSIRQIARAQEKRLTAKDEQ